MSDQGLLEVFSRLRGGTADTLREEVKEWEELGVTGVLVSDHLFGTATGSRREADRPPEPLTLLAAAGALSDRLHVGTIVSNASLLHPALLLRQFAELAVLLGGHRVLAGIGAGWNRPEFEALGMRMPSFAERMQRLEEASALARQLFDEGFANLEGTTVVARDLPLAPLPQEPPSLMLGGGSTRLLEIAGRYADALDLNGSPQAGKVAGSDLRTADKRRRLSTTVTDLEKSAKLVSDASVQAGRPADAVKKSIMLTEIVFCDESEIRGQEEALLEAAGLPWKSLDDSAYAAIGPPERIARLVEDRRRRLGLSRLFLGGSQIEGFCREVMPLLRA
ncbi:LLM class flavin-dependent oxidoreductase [Candidatus Nephthysia bennettiae]|uniref:LLM class flavin-dependent oxidoreductase n=1 Tax=Candidatus Nephthysia bennettiae TaxID=3127016 RepID=A0A934N8V0_9BACT|nr:LLM class flavin-dependent oxidoreductase [Candidatus Dormibacteraeota bacterium]MBJ7611593.1 LLM class flavin-dependent oxidoreductase [Candidatus Dormibacteraeota bacterium]